MIITGQSTHSRHASRTHGVDMDWLCERIHLDSSMSIRYVRTTEHVAEMLPTGAVTTIQWEVIGAIVWHSRTATNQMSIAVFENPLCSAVSALISRTMSIAYRDWTLGRTARIVLKRSCHSTLRMWKTIALHWTRSILVQS